MITESDAEPEAVTRPDRRFSAGHQSADQLGYERPYLPNLSGQRRELSIDLGQVAGRVSVVGFGVGGCYYWGSFEAVSSVFTRSASCSSVAAPGACRSMSSSRSARLRRCKTVLGWMWRCRARPHREGPPAVDQPVEGRPERLRHHLRRPPQRGTQVTTEKEVTPLTWLCRSFGGG